MGNLSGFITGRRLDSDSRTAPVCRLSTDACGIIIHTVESCF